MGNHVKFNGTCNEDYIEGRRFRTLKRSPRSVSGCCISAEDLTGQQGFRTCHRRLYLCLLLAKPRKHVVEFVELLHNVSEADWPIPYLLALLFLCTSHCPNHKTKSVAETNTLDFLQDCLLLDPNSLRGSLRYHGSCSYGCRVEVQVRTQCLLCFASVVPTA